MGMGDCVSGGAWLVDLVSSADPALSHCYHGAFRANLFGDHDGRAP